MIPLELAQHLDLVCIAIAKFCIQLPKRRIMFNVCVCISQQKKAQKLKKDFDHIKKRRSLQFLPLVYNSGSIC